ncbi:hypothetical protein DY218_31145 [Streptomyces triticagri]|uniref:TerD domain-containing protein n=1 Tax=Streptomyces triticagri TaxID=2293568 RepID=A0A372LVV0_9ACTN|nr:TerD family protein [Streptomyces triticagri]RFU82802.1 hypothetical protein DY218_31145 [Streptomyces triticagri]
MGFGFRVGVPGMRVRVSTRGVRTSVGPRAARVSFGGGSGSRISTGVGPFFASTTAGGGGGRRGSQGRRTTSGRTAAGSQRRTPGTADLQRDAETAEFERFREDSLGAHLEEFSPAGPPDVPLPGQLTERWAQQEAKAFHMQGLSLRDRAARAAARQRAESDARAYLAAEQERISGIHENLQRQAAIWWQDLLRNEPAPVIEALNHAYADNRAVACAVGVHGDTASVVMRQPDADSWPARVPGTTPAGRPTMKALSKRDRNQWWLQSMCSHIVATLREGFAVAPGLQAIDIAVLTRVPATQRIGIVTYGTWTRSRIEAAHWRTPEDAVQVLDLADEVECAVTATPTGIKALDVRRVPGLAELLAHTDDAPADAGALVDMDEALTAATQEPEPAPDPYAPVPFAQWVAGSAPDAEPPAPAGTAPATRPETALTAGENTQIELDGRGEVSVGCHITGMPLDLSLLLLDDGRRVPTDAEFIFYNQPRSACGSVRLSAGGATAALHEVPPYVRTIAIAVNADVDSGATFAALTALQLRVTAAGHTYRYGPAVDQGLRAMVLAELYRAPGDPSGTTWKLRAVGQGWSDGLAGLARDHGVDVG